jgi:hypothetical protein
LAIDCGTLIELNVEIDKCYTFVGWEENGVFLHDDNPYRFDLEDDRDLTAKFEIILYDVEVTVAPTGTDNYVDWYGDVDIECDTPISIEAFPAVCWYFTGW